MPRIETSDIFYKIGDKEILKGLSIKLEEEKIVGIIGPNGSGKSTLLKNVYRIIKPTSGAIYLDDKNIDQIPYKDSAKEIAVVAQANDINFNFTVLEMVLFGRSPYKNFLEGNNEEDYYIAREALGKVGLSSYEDRGFHTLSGGEQQRVILARALAQKTSCLVLDEPTNHLDIKYQLSILSLIKSLKVSCLVALHDLNIAAQFCDYVYTVKDGKIVRQGPPKEIFTREFIMEVYEVDSKIIEIDGIINIIYKKPI